MGKLTVKAIQEKTPEWATITVENGKTKCEEWIDDDGNKVLGQRSKVSGKAEGIVQVSVLDGEIFIEGQFE